MKSLLALVVLLLVGTAISEEDLGWMIGKQVHWISPLQDSGWTSFSLMTGTVKETYNQFIYIEYRPGKGAWVQSNWIYSIDNPKVAT